MNYFDTLFRGQTIFHTSIIKIERDENNILKYGEALDSVKLLNYQNVALLTFLDNECVSELIEKMISYNLKPPEYTVVGFNIDEKEAAKNLATWKDHFIVNTYFSSNEIHNNKKFVSSVNLFVGDPKEIITSLTYSL